MTTAKELLGDLSLGEILSLAEMAGRRDLHRGTPEAQAMEATASALQDASPGSGPGLFDPQRREIMGFLEQWAGRIQVQCHGDCFQHSDARVAQCWLRIRKTIR